jgi:NAD+ diphosphatase
MMDNFQKSSKNMFVAQGLDRAHNRRKDPDLIARRMLAPGSFFVAMCQSKVLVAEGEVPRPVMLEWRQLEGHAQGDCTFFLGEENGHSYFAVDLDEKAPGALGHVGRFRDLRAVVPLLSQDDGALLAYAKTLAYWNKRNHFCGACGGRNEIREGGHCRACVNPQCGVVNFPRTDPAVIVLIKSGEKCLLGRQHSWPESMYSVLAGFVEPGESAEGAVAREVFEEVGIRVENIRYHSSQPWPFPCSLMLGFTAEAHDKGIRLGDEELEDARWLGRRELREAVENGVVKLPTPISISYRLIEDWFDAESPFCLRDFAGRGVVIRKEE